MFGGKTADTLPDNITIDKTPPAVAKSISWLPAVVAVSVVLLGVSVALLFAGNKLGIMGLAGSGTVLVVAITVSRFLWLIAALGGLVALGLAALLIYKIWQNRKELMTKQFGLIDLVATVKQTQKFLTDKDKETMFGGKNDHGLAGDIQSPETEAIVAEIRGKDAG